MYRLFYQSKLHCNLLKAHYVPLNKNPQKIPVICALHPAVLSCHYPCNYLTLIEIYQKWNLHTAAGKSYN